MLPFPSIHWEFLSKMNVTAHLGICLRTNALRSSLLQIDKKKRHKNSMEEWLGVMNSEVMKKKTRVANKQQLNLSMNQGNTTQRETAAHSSASPTLSSLGRPALPSGRDEGKLRTPGKAEICIPLGCSKSPRDKHSLLDGDLPRHAQFSTSMSQGKSGNKCLSVQE